MGKSCQLKLMLTYLHYEIIQLGYISFQLEIVLF